MGNWQDDMNRVTSAIARLDGMPSRVLDRVEGDIYDLIQKEFDDGVDPYGRRWDPLAPSTVRRGRRAPPLTDTTAMRRSVAVRAQGNQLVASADDPFPYHQAGTARMPARPILPDERGLPETWSKAIEVAATSGELAELLDAAE